MIADTDIRHAVETLVDRFHPDRVILFGSHSRGAAHGDSDVDLLVVCQVEDSRRALQVAMDRALRGCNFARDIVVLTREEFERDRHIPGTIARPAWLEGRVLSERPWRNGAVPPV
jgi:predicted nucleotidyltransferase